jgi:hypothetical protein
MRVKCARLFVTIRKLFASAVAAMRLSFTLTVRGIRKTSDTPARRTALSATASSPQ